MHHDQAIASLAAERYILGELPAAERDIFEEHYFGCPQCAQDVRDLGQLASGARHIPLPVEEPIAWFERLRQWWAQPAMGLASACAILALTVSTGYQALAPRPAMLATALESHMLRPESRGEIEAVVLRPAQAQVLVEADLPGAAGLLEWTLESVAAPTQRISGTAATPAAGATLKLLLPAAQLRAGESLLTVRAASRDLSYRFRFKILQN